MIRPADLADLDQINRVIDAAVMNWPMPKRVKRLAVPVLKYDASDLMFYHLLVATFKNEVVGVAAWDATLSKPSSTKEGGLFHGLYVLPIVQGQGVGEMLMEAVFADARKQKTPGLLVKAQRVSRHYFETHDLEALVANDSDYPWQFWKQLA